MKTHEFRIALIFIDITGGNSNFDDTPPMYG